MNKTLKAGLYIVAGGAVMAVLMALSSNTAEAFFGDNSNGTYLGDTTGKLMADHNGSGKGKGSAEGNFSMVINASGKADTYMNSVVDGYMDTKGKNFINGVTTND